MTKMTEVVEKSWDLSLYELHRTPQEAVTDHTEIAVSPKSLQSELTCPICLDMLTTTMTTKECLHRFCAECIITALRSGNKECPTCRKKLVSKRSLRPDPNFDQLVAKIFPDREEYEEQQEKVLAILSKNHSQQLMSTIGDAIKAQAAHVKMINRKKNLSDYDELMASHAAVGESPNDPDSPQGEAETVPYRPKKKKKTSLESGGGESQSAVQPNEIEIIFKAHASLTPELVERLGENCTRYIKTCLEASVDHLTKYLELRLKVDLDIKDPKSDTEEKSDEEEDDDDEDSGSREKVDNIKLFVFHSGSYVELTGPETLEMVVEDYWKVNKPLELYYACTVTSS